MKKKLLFSGILLLLSVGLLLAFHSGPAQEYEGLFGESGEQIGKSVLMCYTEESVPYDEIRTFDNWQELLDQGILPDVAGMNEFSAQGDYLADGTLIELTFYWYYTPKQDGEKRQQMILHIYPTPPEDPEKRDEYYILDKSAATATEIGGVTVYSDGNGETMGKYLIFTRPDGVEYQLSSLDSTSVDVMAETMLFFLEHGVDFDAFAMGDSTVGNQVEETGWEPCYTGEDREWEHQYPWAADPLEGESREFDQEEGLSAYFDIGPNGSGLQGYAGAYINCSGTLTVALVDPQVELIEEYAKESDVGFWIIDAEYTQKEIEEASEGLFEEIRTWIEEHPEAKLQIGFSTTDVKKNRYVVELYGPSLEPFYAAFPDLEPCIEVVLHEVKDASAPEEIPREPETTWIGLDGNLTVSVLQPEYPVGVETITVVIENNSLGTAMYGQSYELQKYVDGAWENASGMLSFNAIGYGLEEHQRRTLEFSTSLYPAPLGVGLYRIIGSDIDYTSPDGASTVVTEQYVVEFLVTEDAPEPTGELPEKDGFWLTPAEAIGEDEIQYSMKDPYTAGLTYDIMEEGPQNLGLNVYDRSTGEKLTEEPIWFWADYYQDMHPGENGEIIVETNAGTYVVDVADGEVVVTEKTEPYDAQIPREPVSAATTYGGEITVEMESGRYSTDVGTIAFIITNNTAANMTTEDLWPCDELYNWEYNHCFLDLPEGMTWEEEYWQEPEIFELKAGESKRVEIDLSGWGVPEYTVSEAGEILEEREAPLGRSIYTMSFNRRTFTFSDGSELTATLTVEFVLE